MVFSIVIVLLTGCYAAMAEWPSILFMGTVVKCTGINSTFP